MDSVLSQGPGAASCLQNVFFLLPNLTLLKLPYILDPLTHPCIYTAPSAQAYLVKEGKLSKGAIEMIGDLLDEDPGYHKSLLESLRSPSTYSRTDE